MQTSSPFRHLLFAFPSASRATGTWTYLALWLTRCPLEGRHGGLSAAYFPIAVMRSVSQVPSCPPTFPLYKARSLGSVTAPRGKLWNRTAGLVSGRADSAVRLLLIPYYPAYPSPIFFFFLFLITISPHHRSFLVALTLPGHCLSFSLCQAMRAKGISFCVNTKRNLRFKRGCANAPDSSSCFANCLSVSCPTSCQHLPKNRTKGKEKTVCLYSACIHACGYLHLSTLLAPLTRYAEEQVFQSTSDFISWSRWIRARGRFV